MCTREQQERQLAELERLQRKELQLRARAEEAERKVLQFSARIDGLEAQMQLLTSRARAWPLYRRHR